MKLNQILKQIDAEELTGVCRGLIRFKTVNPPGDELEAAQFVLDYLRQAGFEGEIVPNGARRGSVLARFKGSGESPALALNGHLDVVPVGAERWRHEPFEGVVEDGKVWGRGSADMKGGLAAMLVAARLLAQSGLRLRGDLVVLATAGEEVEMLGARSLAAHPHLGLLKAILISEPTLNRLGLAERGVFWPEFVTHGQTAHGSTPDLGRNAILMMVALLSELDRLAIPYTPHPVLGHFTRSINTIKGGVKVNVVPDQACALVDMRTVPGQDHSELLRHLEDFVQDLERRVPGLNASVRLTYDLPPAETSPDEPVVKAFQEAVREANGHTPDSAVVRFATEAAIFVPALGVPTLIYGPGDPALAHQPDEHVQLEKMVEATRAYLAAAVRLLE
ncbi:MAG: M20 family metallopeptidase [Anaerolineales bacterium]